MSKFIRIAAVCILTALTAFGLTQPASADVSIRDSQVSDLYIRDEVPSVAQVEKQFAAFWNPNIGMDPKIEVTYNGPAARPALERVMETSKTMDFFSIQGRALPPFNISGNTMTINVNGVMAGFPAQSSVYHYIREDGLWKYDFKAICAEIQCQGNPDFGY
ncbi:MAG: hypothetical protein HOQ36_24570 [Nocardia sp.]|nr:hypothetical protein [Nocardia sp.]